MGLWILNLVDLGMTLRASADGVLDEQNPLARLALSCGPSVLLAGKLAVLIGASCVLFQYRARRCAELASAFLLTVYVGVAFQWKYCYEMYDIIHGAPIESKQLATVDAILRYLPIF